MTGGDGRVTWDYPFVAGVIQLSDDVRSVFDGAGLTKDTIGLHNLVSWSAHYSPIFSTSRRGKGVGEA